MLETETIKEELDKMSEDGKTHVAMIYYLLGRFTGQESIPYEIIKYAMSLRPEVSIIVKLGDPHHYL